MFNHIVEFCDGRYRYAREDGFNKMIETFYSQPTMNLHAAGIYLAGVRGNELGKGNTLQFHFFSGKIQAIEYIEKYIQPELYK